MPLPAAAAAPPLTTKSRGGMMPAMRSVEKLAESATISTVATIPTTWQNVVTACSKCNNRKGDRLPDEAGMPLLTVPGEPDYVYLAWAVRRVTEIQEKYIRMFYGDDALSALGSHRSPVI